MSETLALPRLFAAKVDFDAANGCWNWLASKNHQGYGWFAYQGRAHLAHRVAWMVLVGSVPDGLVLDHRCFNRSCVNPAHLRAVTAKQNSEHRQGPKPDNPSGIRGVSWYKPTKRWRARIGHNGGWVHGGYFQTREEAEAAVLELRAKYFTHDD